jgi:hypothetical protein
MESTHAQDETKKAGRPKGPIDTHYHVLLLEGEGSFEHLTKGHPVKAKSRKGALEALGANLDGSQSFLILKDTDFKIATPRTETETIERTKFVL